MNINVPNRRDIREHFWEEPPQGSIEFCAVWFPPPCKVGDPLIFRFDGVPVAKAVVHRIEKPGMSRCERTGGFENCYKVYWLPETFVDLRSGGVS